MTTATVTFSAGVFNIEHGGRSAPSGGHDRLDEALAFLLSHTPRPPDVLALPECTAYGENGGSVMRHVVNTLSAQLPEGHLYEPFFGPWGERRNPPGLLVNRGVFEVTNYYLPNVSASPYKGIVKARASGIDVVLAADHWPGGSGREEFDRSAQRWKPWSSHNALFLGDLNTTSGWERDERYENPSGPSWLDVCAHRDEEEKLEQKGWENPATGEWEIDTRAFDKLRAIGWTDAGERADDPTNTTAHPVDGLGLRIDRIVWSPKFHGDLVEGSYLCAQPPTRISDHAYVACGLTLAGPPHRSERPQKA